MTPEQLREIKERLAINDYHSYWHSSLYRHVRQDLATLITEVDQLQSEAESLKLQLEHQAGYDENY